MSNSLAVIKKETIDIVESRIKTFTQKGELHFPKNYSPDNALKAAWLQLQEVKDRSKRPALEVCSRSSVANALLNMVVQGLNPAKKQCYFIVYGNQLACQRSYFGTMAMVRRLYPEVKEIVAATIHEGDKVTININKGKRTVDEHRQDFGNQDKPITGAYCVVLDQEDNIMASDVMTFDQLKSAWKQSRNKPITDSGDVKAGSTHDKFSTEMAKKTVINRVCKPLMNSSDDSDLMINAIRESDEIRTDAELKEEIQSEANGDIIDIEIDDSNGSDVIHVDGDITVNGDISVDYKIQMEKLKDMDEKSYAEALEVCGVNQEAEFSKDDFKAVSKKFSEIVSSKDEGQEQESNGAGPNF